MAGQAKLRIRDITIIAILSAILLVQEEILTFLPNIQFTVFLLVLYSKKLGFIRTSFIVVIHVILDNLVMSSFSLVYTPFMFIGWMFIPLIFCTLCKKVEKPLILALVSVICSFLYCFVYIIPMVIFYHINPIAYLVSDIPFELILAACSFVTVFLLYKPLGKLFDKMNITYTNKIER